VELFPFVPATPAAPTVIVAEPPDKVTIFIAVPPALPPSLLLPPPPPVTVTLHFVIPAGTDQVPEEVNTARFENPPAGAAALVQVVPLDVSTLPLVPGATV
jgi:hypothetical protein